MINRCAICEKEINDGEKCYEFMTQRKTSTSLKQNRIHYGRFCASCFSKLSLEEDT